MKYELSRTEEQIMDFLWTNNRPVKTGEIMDYFTENKGKERKRQTLNTLLIRLEEKGVIVRRRGIVEAKYTRADLEHIECRDFVKTKFQNSLSKFMAAFAGEERISEKEAAEMIDMINTLKEK